MNKYRLILDIRSVIDFRNGSYYIAYYYAMIFNMISLLSIIERIHFLEIPREYLKTLNFFLLEIH